MTESMVERVGRALAKEDGYAYDPLPYDSRARAAITAMRDPTFDMWMAGLKRHGECRVESAKGLYMVMVDEALKTS